jgi:transposase
MLLVGVDWAERHHDVCLLDEQGAVLAKRRIPDGLGGVAELHALVARHAEDPGQVVVGIETDRGLLIGALLAAGYQVYAVNPLAVSRYRDRHSVSGAKSDRGDAKVLADLVRTDRHNHRQVAGDSPLAVGVKVLARAQQRLVWTRQEQVNTLRSALREFYPAALAAFGTDLAGRDALAVLALAPTPAAGRQLSHAAITGALRQAGRRLRVQARAAAIQAALCVPQLDAPVAVAAAYGQVVVATVAVLHALNAQVVGLEEELTTTLGRHPQAPILLSQPGLGVVLAARLLGEFGDDPHRYQTAKGRKAYAGTAPITRASGTRTVVSARVARNDWLANACTLWAFAALNTSPGARRCCDRYRAAGNSHQQAWRALGNRLVGILHGCLANDVVYQEQLAWPDPQPAVA